ncbi:hypothetical protein BD408DRAFT_448832 [Parasitella parasitica]|nr:hypothetical protein BD408DRAFT_448832 [Parasitella parasitica]
MHALNNNHNQEVGHNSDHNSLLSAMSFQLHQQNRRLKTRQQREIIQTLKTSQQFLKLQLQLALADLPGKDDGSNDDNDSEDSEDEDNDGANQDDAEQFRACSISLSQVFRDDLPDDIKSLFINTIGATMEQVSNYTSDFSKQVLKVALLFAEYTFESNDGNIELVYDGGNTIASILPEGYLKEDTTFNAHYQSLFLETHLEQIHSTYYGQVGIEESTLKKSPLHKAIVNVLGRDKANPHQNLSSHVMKMARQQYCTNLRIMLSKNTTVNKLLRKLLNFLLLIHLSPDQNHAIKAKKTERESTKLRKNHKSKQRVTNCSIPMAKISVLNKTRNGRRKLFF